MVFQFSNTITSKMNKSSGPPSPPNFDGANAVWSTKLRISTYTGACLKLRRSTDSVIADFYADASGNLGTGLGATGTSYSSWKGAATTFVDTWYDQSDKNNNINQNNAGYQPIYSDISGVLFNGSAYLDTSAYSATLNTQTFTIISSATNLNSGWLGTLISSRSGSTVLSGYTIYKLDNTNRWYLQLSKNDNRWLDLITDVIATINIRYILAFNRNGTTNIVTSNIKNTSTSAVTNNSISNPSFSVNPVTTTRIGAGDPGGPAQYFFNGYINDLFYFGKSLSNIQQTNVSNLL